MRGLAGYLSYLTLIDDFKPLSKGRWAATTTKLASLFFDELILNTPTPPGEPIFLPSVIKKEPGVTRDTVNELERIWVLPAKYLPNYKFLRPNPWVRANKEIIRTAGRVTEKETKREVQKIGGKISEVGVQHEIAWAGAGLIDSVNTWFRIVHKKDCCFLPNYREKQVLEALFTASAQRSAFEIFSEVLECRLPNFGRISWNRIVELRHSSHIEAFREKMFDLYQLVAKERKSDIKILARDMIESDLKLLADELKPSPTLTVVKGVASALLPPPIAALDLGRQVLKEHKLLKRYGWLYFLIDLEKTPLEKADSPQVRVV